MSGDLAVRPRDLDTLVLAEGAHDESEGQMCLLEAAAFMAGEPWSDAPVCVCPVIAAFGRAWNDALDDTDRQMLVPYIPRIVGTAASDEVEEARSWMAADWLIRTYTPAWLRLAGLDEHADALAGAAPVDGAAALDTVRPAIAAVRDAAWAAAGDAARDARAARAALRPTVEALQASALDLLDRMIDCEVAS